MDKVVAELRASLGESESILWSGRPKNVKLLDEGSRGGCILRWCICAVVFLACMAYIAFFEVGGQNANKFMAVIAAITVVTALLPFIHTRMLRNRVFYFVTNHRVITCRRAVPLKLHSIRLDEIGEINCETLSSGMSCVYFGNITPSVRRAARLNLVGEMPVDDGGQPRFPVVLWSTDDAEGALEAIRSCIETENLA